MKNQYILWLALVLAVLLGAGCESLTREVVETRTIDVPVATNSVERVVRGADGVERVVTETVVVTEPRQEDVVVDVVANPQLASSIDAAKAVNQTFNPTPSAPLINIALGLFGGLASAVAAYQRKRLGGERSARRETEDVLRSVARGVEEYSLRASSSGVKGAISERAGTDGTEPALKRFLLSNLLN